MPGCMPSVLGRLASWARASAVDGVGMDVALFQDGADDAFVVLG